jgi:hypothetical protein
MTPSFKLSKSSASRRSSCSVCFRALTSISVPTMRSGVSSASRITLPLAATHSAPSVQGG